MSSSGQDSAILDHSSSDKICKQKRKRARNKTKSKNIVIARDLLFWSDNVEPYDFGRQILSTYQGEYIKEMFLPSPNDWDNLLNEEKDNACNHIKVVYTCAFFSITLKKK